MPENRLFLHIGTHKTGTTSFQETLGANARALRRRGFQAFSVTVKKKGFFGFRRKNYNVGRFAQSFLRTGIATVARLQASAINPKPELQNRQRAAYVTELQAIKAPNLIVSAEAFTFLRTPEEKAQVRSFLDALGREVTIVLVRRDEAGWRASWENQLRKNPKVWQRNEALPDEQRADGEWYFDWPAIVDFWSDLGELVIVDYDAAMAEEDNVIPAIYRAMDLDPNGLTMNVRRNERVALDDDDEDDEA